MEIRKISRCRPRSGDGDVELGHFTLCFAEDGKEMHVLKIIVHVPAIVVLIKSFAW